jgi:hypothetical protein
VIEFLRRDVPSILPGEVEQVLAADELPVSSQQVSK